MSKSSTISPRKKRHLILSGVVGTAVVAMTLSSAALLADGKGKGHGYGYHHGNGMPMNGDCNPYGGQGMMGQPGQGQGKGQWGQQGQRGSRGQGMSSPDRGGPLSGLMRQLMNPQAVSQLNLTAEQQAEIVQLMTEFRESQHPNQPDAEAQAKRQAALADLLSADTVTPESLRALQAQNIVDNQDPATVLAEKMAAILNVLTVEQRQALSPE